MSQNAKDGQGYEPEPIEKLLRQIMALMGYDNSESATHDFARLLFEATSKALEESERSFDEGLFLNCLTIITKELDRSFPRAFIGTSWKKGRVRKPLGRKKVRASAAAGARLP